MESLENRNLLAAGYLEMNLVSNQAGAALLQDPALNLPWGIALPPDSGKFWVDNAGSGAVTLYGGDVAGSALTKNPLTVEIPGGAPTADVFNNTGSSTDFVINGPGGASGAATYLFASLDGRISGWNASVSQDQAIQVAHVKGAFFTGLALGASDSGNVLYAADFQNGKIDVFDGSFQQTSLSGDFTDPNLPSGYAPFNVQNIDGKLYVTYAMQQSSSGQGGGHQEDSASGDSGGVFTPAAKGGIVDVFDLNGKFVKRFATNGDLNAPWGLAMAPSGFGDFAGDLLVANFGDGRITAYDPNGTFDASGTAAVGQLTNAAGDPISINHLLGLSFGNGATAGDASTLFFTADAASLSNSGGMINASGNGIVLLDPSGAGSLREVGNANVTVGKGGIAVDSSNAGAIFLAGNPQLSASQLNVVGNPGLTEHGHPDVNVSGDINTNASTVPDPLLSLTAPTMPSNSFNAVNATDQMNLTLQPGAYSGGINVGGNATVVLSRPAGSDGIYYLQGGISVTGQGRLIAGPGVTIYIASTGGQPALRVSGGGVVKLSGNADLNGVALFVARGLNEGISITGRGVVDVTGTLYSPDSAIKVAGNGKLLLASDAQNNLNSQLIAADLNVAGNGDVDVNALTHGPFSLFGSLQPNDSTPLNILGTSLAATEGLSFSGAVAAFTASAADAAASDFTATIDWGDGSSSAGTVTASGNGGFIVTGRHAYAEQGSQTAVVTVQDNNNHTVTVDDAVQVADASLLALGNRITVSQGLSASGVTVASFVDAGGADAASDYTATINWGDGSSSTGTVSLSNGTLNVTGSHTYAATGQYSVKVSIQDEGGAAATANSIAVLGISDSDALFVSDAFESILGRAADDKSLLFFVNALQNGMTRQQFASLLTHSTEYLDDKIDQDYQHYLGRHADSAGLAYWLSQLRGGMTDEQLESQFIGSAEYFEHAGGTNQAWVQEMYFDLLGRLPDSSGVAYWLQVLASGGVRAEVADGFAASPEREAMTVENDYQTYLGRNPGQSEVNYWVSNFQHGTNNEQVVAGFVGSQEFFQQHGGNQGNGSGSGNGNESGHGNGNDNGNGIGNGNEIGNGNGNVNNHGNGNGHGNGHGD